MIIQAEWLVFDTNIWLFGLRNHPACNSLLQRLGELKVVMPRQILRELQANLTETELHNLFQLFKQYPDQIRVSWDKANLETVRKYQGLGCKLGDAAVSAHLEELQIMVLVTQNRDFLQEIQGLPFEKLTAEQALKLLNPSKR